MLKVEIEKELPFLSYDIMFLSFKSLKTILCWLWK